MAGWDDRARRYDWVTERSIQQIARSDLLVDILVRHQRGSTYGNKQNQCQGSSRTRIPTDCDFVLSVWDYVCI